MAVVQCKNGHYYDNERYTECPHCAGGNTGRSAGDQNATVAMNGLEMEEYAAYYVNHYNGNQQVEMDDQKTVSLYENVQTMVCGWLVCSKGAGRGQDYRILAGFNRVGRDLHNDIVIKDDLQIARKEHCAVVYETRKNVFYLVPGSGNLTYLNDALLEKTEVLKDGDKIMIGDTELVFIAYCSGDRKWENS